MTIGEFFTKCDTSFDVIVIVDKDRVQDGHCYKHYNDIPIEYYYLEIYSFKMTVYDTPCGVIGVVYVLEITV